MASDYYQRLHQSHAEEIRRVDQMVTDISEAMPFPTPLSAEEEDRFYRYDAGGRFDERSDLLHRLYRGNINAVEYRKAEAALGRFVPKRRRWFSR